MKKHHSLIFAWALLAASPSAFSATLGAASATIDWSTFEITDIGGTAGPTLSVLVPPTFDYASVDTNVGSSSVLNPVGFGATAAVSDDVVSGSSSIDPFDADGVESLPGGTPSGSIISSSSISDAGSGGEFVEIETNRTVMVSASGAGFVLFEVDFTLETSIAAASAPVAQSIARVTLGKTEFPDGTSFILSGVTESLELLNVGLDSAHSHTGTLAFIYEFSADESIFLAANALTTLDNINPAVVVPLPASILFLLSALPFTALRTR